jgi:regulatory protein
LKNSDGDNFGQARQYAFLLLRYRDRSEKEIVLRLQKKGFTEETGEKVRDYLKGKGFVDDARYAASLKRNAVEQKHLGKAGVFRYLLLKGIPAETAKLMAGEDDDYAESAAALVERKLKQYGALDDMTVKRRLWAALARKGYSPDVIRTALKKFKDIEDSGL